MANVLDRNFDFATNGTVTSAGLHNLIDETNIYAGLISTQEERTSVGTGDLLLIANSSSIGSPQIAANRTTVYNLFEDALTGGTYVNAQLSGNLTYGTATGSRTISTGANITNGTISTLIAGTTTSTAAAITNGTITNGTITTALIPTLTAGTTTGTAGIFTSGTIATLNSTTGTIATLNSTTGTITNLSTTLAGDFTISNGTGTLGTSGATAGTYGSVSAIPFLTVNAKGIITSATTGTFSTTPADGSITPAKLSQPFTSATAIATTSGTAIDFTGIPSWVKRITVMLNQVSTSGASLQIVQIGTSSGIVNSGYTSGATYLPSAGGSYTTVSSGFNIPAGSANSIQSGAVQIFYMGLDLWIYSYVAVNTGENGSSVGGGSKTLSGTLDRIRLTTANGTDTFDSGSVNILYEG